MAVNFHEFSALPLAPSVVPIEFSPTPTPLSFGTLLGDMWRSIYPSETHLIIKYSSFLLEEEFGNMLLIFVCQPRFPSVSAPTASTVVTALLLSVPFTLPQWQESPVFVIKRAWCKRIVLINTIPPSSRVKCVSTEIP